MGVLTIWPKPYSPISRSFYFIWSTRMFGVGATADEFDVSDGSIRDRNIILGVPNWAVFKNENLRLERKEDQDVLSIRH